MARYGYDYDVRQPMAPYGWYPGAFWGGAPMYGWGAWGGGWGWPPYAPLGYGTRAPDYPPRRPPRDSPGWGRGGDREVRDWARRHGYDAGYAIHPRPGGRYRR